MTPEAVGLVHDLAPQRVMRAQVQGTDLAIWRSASGRLSAWGNRCPHRGMRLSHGFVRGESLACAYHGWHYNCAGQCHYIPAHPELAPPETIKTVMYSAAEHGDVLWVSVDGEISQPSLPGNCSAVRTITFNCSMNKVIDAFLASEFQDSAGNRYPATQCGNDTLMLTLSQPGDSDAIVVLLQQPTTGKTAAHILADVHLDTENRIAISRWSESVRRLAESTAQDVRQ